MYSQLYYACSFLLIITTVNACDSSTVNECYRYYTITSRDREKTMHAARRYWSPKGFRSGSVTRSTMHAYRSTRYHRDRLLSDHITFSRLSLPHPQQSVRDYVRSSAEVRVKFKSPTRKSGIATAKTVYV